MSSASKTVSNDEENDDETSMGYQQTLMYGQYFARSLGDYAKQEAKLQRKLQSRRRKDLRRRLREMNGKKDRGKFYRTSSKIVAWVWKHTFAKIGEDWVFLALLGMLMAVLSYIVDEGIDRCNAARMILYKEVDDGNVFLKFVAWVSLPVFLVLFASGFVHVVAPQAIGSGIPEMKTILRGVVLKEYLTFKTLVAKVVGLTATLGSGMPLGKEGPFVHIASIVATLLTSMVTKFQGVYVNESRQNEMLAAACAVGVACCFGSPIGGVLFSIEVTSAFFAVRNYWRGFFAAVFGATMFRLLDVWMGNSETLIAVFRTEFNVDFPYDIKELVVFVGIGMICGVGGALYVYTHRRYVLWMRGNKSLSKFLQRNRFIYPFLVSLTISMLSFPPWLGQYHAAALGTHKQIVTLFSNHTWVDNSTSKDDFTNYHHEMVRQFWMTPSTNIFSCIVIFMLVTFYTSIVAATLPVPTGILIPAFKVGAAFGRLVGESVFLFAPNSAHNIVSGGYAIAGAAAFTGAVTHTISISVIVFEMTGQITHLFPVLISVLMANAIASLLQPSCYDSIIMIKKLPYLPDILPSSSSAYHVYVEHFMRHDVKYIWYGISYAELRDILMEDVKIRSFPLVDNPSQMILLGSIQRTELVSAIERLIGNERRAELAKKRLQAKVESWTLSQEEERWRHQQDEEEERSTEKDTKMMRPDELVIMETRENEDTSSMQRRPSRFEVVSVPTPLVDRKKEDSVEEEEEEEEEKEPVTNVLVISSKIEEKRTSLLDSLALDSNSPAVKALSRLTEQPKKSILKKSNCNTIHAIDLSRPRLPMMPSPKTRGRMLASLGEDPIEPSYRTVTGAESRWKSALDNFQNIFKRPSSSNLDKSVEKMANNFDPSRRSTVNGQGDLSSEEWEEEEMKNAVRFDKCHIDPAPFQLVEKSSLLKVHSMFSMLGVKHAYVTAIGRLIGVVGLKELRSAIENANSGHFGFSKIHRAETGVGRLALHIENEMTEDESESDTGDEKEELKVVGESRRK